MGGGGGGGRKDGGRMEGENTQCCFFGASCDHMQLLLKNQVI